MNSDKLADKVAQAIEELESGSPTDALRSLEKGHAEMSSSLDVIPDRTRAELTLRFIELAQRDLQLFQLKSAEMHLKEAARLATHSVKLEKLEPWK